MTQQGVAPSAGWAAVDNACREAGVTNPVREPTPEQPSVAPNWDTAATLDAARADRERVAVDTSRAVVAGGDRAVAASATVATAPGDSWDGGDEEPGSATRVGASDQSGLAAIREVIERIREQHPELQTDAQRASAQPISPPGDVRRRGTGDDLRRYRQRAHVAAERARREAERRRGPYAS